MKIISYLFIILGLFLWYLPKSATTLAEKNSPITEVKEEVVVQQSQLMNLINNYRLQKGRQKLIHSESLCTYANQRAKQIVTDWSHNPFWSGVENRKFNNVGENLARYFSSEQEVFEAWKQSETHNTVMLQPFTHGCIGHHYNGDHYYVLELGL